MQTFWSILSRPQFQGFMRSANNPMADSTEISLSLEETKCVKETYELTIVSKLRVSLGLKPLKPNVSDEKESEAKKNYDSHRAAQQETARHSQLRSKIEAAKNKRLAHEKLQGTTLADAEDVHSLEWIKRQKARQKQLAERQAKELLERDRQSVAAAKRQATTEGIKIKHDVDMLMDQAGDEDEFGHGQVLVLKDSTIEENEREGDELFSLAVAEKEKKRKREDEAKRKTFNPMDPDKHTLYQEEEEKVFVIGSAGTIKVEKKTEELEEIQGKRAVNMSYEKMREMQDYYTKEDEDVEVSFKKPKKKKRSGKITRVDDEVLGFTNATQDFSSTNFVDDDDLQAALARARKVARKQQSVDVSEILKRGEEFEKVEEDNNGLVLSATAEFVRNLPSAPVKRENPELEIEPKAEPVEVKREETPEDVEMDVEDGQDLEVKVEHESDDEPVNEPLVAKGMAATLALLKGRGEVTMDPEQRSRDQALLDQLKWKKEQRIADLKREKEKALLKQKQRSDVHNARGRDRVLLEEEMKRQEELEDRRRAKEATEKFKDYKPEIKLQYTDEYGRAVGPKEAFKMLSYQFHGIQSGKAKTEKKLRRMEEELKLQTDTTVQTADKLESVTKRLGQAHVVLTKGNRGNAELLDSLKAHEKSPE
jgi:U4/U6.U5 tri-snRNP-associated protein 1